MVPPYIPHDGPVVSRAEAKAAGLKRFFTGRPCRHGHLSERYIRGQCIECSAIYRKTWAKANPERQAKYHSARAAREADRAKARARAKAWYYANKSRANAAAKAGRAANPEAARARRKAWIAVNAEKHRESKRAATRRRRAKNASAEGDHSAADILSMLEKQKGKCPFCRRSIRHGYHVDHVVPIAKGGTHWITNIQLLCPSCNHRKGTKEPIKWAYENGLLL